MAGRVVIDLISSSPPSRPVVSRHKPARKRRSDELGLEPTNVAHFANYNRRRRVSPPLSIDDDLDWFGEHLNSSVSDRATALPRAVAGPCRLSAKSAPAARNDPIEICSSPDQRGNHIRDKDDDHASDWLCTSPSDNGIDGTATKPVANRPAPRVTTGEDRINATARVVSNPTRAARHELDPISSSIPETTRVRQPIDIESESEVAWDGESSSISDGYFPDVRDILPSREIAQQVVKKKAWRTTATPRGQMDKSAATGPAEAEVRKRKEAKTKEEREREKEEREREKETKAAAREAEMARKQKAKEEMKAERAKEKQSAAALAEANKVKTDKKISAKEMIVDLPESLDDAVALQTRTLLKELAIQDSQWMSPVPKVVRWRRKVTTRWDDEAGHYQPVPMRIEMDKYVLAVMTAQEFVNACLVADGANGANLDVHVRSMKRYFGGCTVIYLVEGLGPWMRKNRNLRNRQFTSAVRGELEEDGSSSTQSRRRKPVRAEYVDEDIIEDNLLELQVTHGALIHHTNAGIETAQWIVTFTQHISTVPYRRRRDEANAVGAGFCMESGQIRTGDNAKDTYARMLQEITRITAPISFAITAEFPSVSALVRGLKDGGPATLQDVYKCNNREGDRSDRTIGQAVSKRMYKVFTCQDESSMDI